MLTNTTHVTDTEQCLELNPGLLNFLNEWDDYYKNRVIGISI